MPPLIRMAHKKPTDERLEPEDVSAVSPLLLKPEPPEEERLAYRPETTVLQEDLALGKDTASGAGTSGGFGAFQPFLTESELERRSEPGSWNGENGRRTF